MIILVILLVSYLVQILVNMYIAYTGKWCTYDLWLYNLKSYHWAVWLPVFGFCAQIYFGLWNLWQVIKRLWNQY